MTSKPEFSMDQGEKTMLENLQKNTGKSLEEWISFVKEKSFAKHGEILKFLKEEIGLTHGFANLIALKTLKSDAGSVADKEDLIRSQYVGKEQFIPIYETLVAEISKLGPDIELAPKKANVSVRRKKQFALLHPITKTRFEIGINFKGQKPEGKLLPSGNAMCTHKIIIEKMEDIDQEVLHWIKSAYEHAG